MPNLRIKAIPHIDPQKHCFSKWPYYPQKSQFIAHRSLRFWARFSAKSINHNVTTGRASGRNVQLTEYFWGFSATNGCFWLGKLFSLRRKLFFWLVSTFLRTFLTKDLLVQVPRTFWKCVSRWVTRLVVYPMAHLRLRWTSDLTQNLRNRTGPNQTSQLSTAFVVSDFVRHRKAHSFEKSRVKKRKAIFATPSFHKNLMPSH